MLSINLHYLALPRKQINNSEDIIKAICSQTINMKRRKKNFVLDHKRLLSLLPKEIGKTFKKHLWFEVSKQYFRLSKINRSKVMQLYNNYLKWYKNNNKQFQSEVEKVAHNKRKRLEKGEKVDSNHQCKKRMKLGDRSNRESRRNIGCRKQLTHSLKRATKESEDTGTDEENEESAMSKKLGNQ